MGEVVEGVFGEARKRAEEERKRRAALEEHRLRVSQITAADPAVRARLIKISETMMAGGRLSEEEMEEVEREVDRGRGR